MIVLFCVFLSLLCVHDNDFMITTAIRRVNRRSGVSLDLVVSICVYFVFFSYCIYVVLLSAQWDGPNGIEAWSLRLLFLQCFDTVGWVY